MHTPPSSLLLILLVATATASSHAAATITCVPQEREALLAFKQGFTGDPAGRLASWRQGGGDCCRWRGVRCSNRTGHVVGLNLRNADYQTSSYEDTALVGQISSALLSLHHLEHLDLSLNNVSGPAGRVPEFLGLLKNLRYLNLSGMPLSGKVPPHLGNLSNLHYLDLSPMNDLFPWGSSPLYSTDISWVSNLPLRYLNLDSVDLTRVVDWAHVVNLVPSLKVLRLPGCSLASANQSLQHLNLTQLEELSLSADYLDHSFDQPVASCWFWNLTSLVHLELSGTFLYGQMPDALGGMTSLQVLDMSYSFGNINMRNANMRNLCNLEIIDFTYSSIDGNITELLPHCSPNKLNELSLGDNNFGGVLPNWVGQWTSLQILDLSCNNITGHVPSEICQLDNLVTLDLSNNGFTGPVCSEIGMLCNLTSLDLSGNNLSGVITHEHLGGLTNLRYLDLSSNSLKIMVDPEWLPPFRLEFAYLASCQMDPIFPNWLKSQTDISELNISRASISDKLPDWFFTTFSMASTLDISNNRISGTLPINLENMTFLERLYLNSNHLSGPIPRLPLSLFELDISGNSLSGALPSNISAGNLDYLNIASNHINGTITQSICQLNNLRHLNLANNHFYGEFPLCFEPVGLHVLILRNNRLSGGFPSFLKTSTYLNTLDLAWNNFSGRIPMWIGDLTELRILQLGHNMFTESIPSTITRLSSLSLLNLADNNISGSLPWHFSNLTGMVKKCAFTNTENVSTHSPLPGLKVTSFTVNLSVITKGQERYYKNDELYEMVSIDLSSNQLTGSIPEGIASLDGVINLNLSWNQLSGKIPNKIGGMQSLESLDLSENKIYGKIPQSLSNLTYLSYMDLSFNDLKGRIPSGGQLDTLYAEYPFMYKGNNDLCGFPLQKNCSSKREPKHGDHEGDEHDSKVLSFSFGLGVGYVVGLWVVFCAILLKKPWRIAYFCLVEKAFDEVYVFVFVTWDRWAKKEAKQ